MPSTFRETARKDFLASIVVFLVALPLCMGIALASGAPTTSGLITGIVAGLVVGWLAGSPLQVSGPAAGLSVLVFDLIQRSRADFLTRHPDQASRADEYALGVLGAVVFIAGGTQLLAGLLRWGQWFRAVSPAVVHGMLAGIGVLIFVGQFHVMIDEAPRGSGLANLLALPEAVWKAVVPDGEGTTSHRWAARLGILTIVSMLLWKMLVPKRLQVIPAPLVGVVLAALESASLELAAMGVKHVQMGDSLLGAIRLPDLDLLAGSVGWPLLAAGLTMAVVASAETLLCATAVDQMYQGPRTRYDRELAAQGVGNMVCGVLGGLPMTGVIVRSAANLEAGARTRLSAVLHGAWLLVFVVLCPGLLSLIPTASLAAILVFTGYKLMDPKAVRALWSHGRGEVVIYAATVLMIVATDLLTGVLVGVGLSAAKLLYTFARLSVKLETEGEGRMVLRLRGAATFLRLPKLAAVLESIPPETELHVHLEHLHYIDHACLDLLVNWEKQHEATGGSLVIDWDTLTARFHRPRPLPAPRPESLPPRTNGKGGQLPKPTEEAVPEPDATQR
ncbi:MAG TPA: SulP family inorganic anion transporter [Gemmataceae bacterium]|nr:SulP family inorganic anion transporter [Gemmataceae bacterium]